MGERSASADRRRAVAAVACAALAIAACTATSPPPLPPRRVDFPAQAPPPGGVAPVLPRPADLPAAAEAPDRDERYTGWTLAADAVSIVPLVEWTAHPKQVYLAAPALLLVPTIHAAYGELRSAGISLAMRAGMVGLTYLGYRWAHHQCNSPSGSQEQSCLPIGPIFLIDIAVVIPVVIDSSFLARRRRPATEWDRLPTLSAAISRDGRGLLTLSARF